MATDKSRLTLSQAVLAPISSILQAQVHASRAFLNLVFQMGFKHKPIDDDGNIIESDKDLTSDLYTFDFVQEKVDEQGRPKRFKVRFPVLAALPLNALAIEEAEVAFSMTLDSHYSAQQQFSLSSGKAKRVREEEKFDQLKRPWYVIEEPVDLTGKIGEESRNGAKIDIRLKLGKGEIPAELKKFISTASDFGMASEVDSSR